LDFLAFGCHADNSIKTNRGRGSRVGGLVHQRAWQAERSNPPFSRFVEVDDVRMHYFEFHELR
jgi:hypothetical protein